VGSELQWRWSDPNHLNIFRLFVVPVDRQQPGDLALMIRRSFHSNTLLELQLGRIWAAIALHPDCFHKASTVLFSPADCDVAQLCKRAKILERRSTKSHVLLKGEATCWKWRDLAGIALVARLFRKPHQPQSTVIPLLALHKGGSRDYCGSV
jgi:hypothetical protein